MEHRYPDKGTQKTNGGKNERGRGLRTTSGTVRAMQRLSCAEKNSGLRFVFPPPSYNCSAMQQP